MVNFSTYLEKLSETFMRVGRSAPRYQSMALVYPRSKKLQDLLAEYFIIVVGFCHNLLKFTKKSALSQIVKTMSDAEIKGFETRLNDWAGTIKEEVTALMAKRIEEEAEENSRLRALANSWSEKYSLEKKVKARIEVLDLCSTYDHESTWKQTRKTGNATLLKELPEHQAWKTGTTSSTLIYTGKLGSGKSVLLANVVDDLNLHHHQKPQNSLLKARIPFLVLSLIIACLRGRLNVRESLCPKSPSSKI
jgi:ankyrin repeat domain-containing protein 50